MSNPSELPPQLAAMVERLLKNEQSQYSPSKETRYNAFRGRSEKTVLINGYPSNWVSIKGGTHTAEQPKDGTSYEILFNPTNHDWLKLVPPNMSPQYFEIVAERLRYSAYCAQVAAQIAGLRDEANKIVYFDNCVVDGGRTVGFVSPHLGASLGHFIELATGSRDSMAIPEQFKPLMETSYRLAFFQAVYLYLNYNIWMDDPNPGNILINNIRGAKVVLIDFSNKKQYEDATYEDIMKNPHIPPARLRTLVERESVSKLRLLRQLFDQHLTRRGMTMGIGDDFINKTAQDHAQAVLTHWKRLDS